MIKKIFLSLLFLQLIFTATPALAATKEICFSPQIKIFGMEKIFKPCSDKTPGSYAIDGNSIGNFILVMFKYLLGIVGILSAIIMIIAGVLWLTAGGNSQRVTEAQGYIKGSLSGLLLTLFSFTILATINPDLVSFKSISLSKVGNRPSSCCRECVPAADKKCGDVDLISTKDSKGAISFACPTDSMKYDDATHICKLQTDGSYKKVSAENCCQFKTHIPGSGAISWASDFALGLKPLKWSLDTVNRIGTGCESGNGITQDYCNSKLTKIADKWWVPASEDAKLIEQSTCSGSKCQPVK